MNQDVSWTYPSQNPATNLLEADNFAILISIHLYILYDY